ncbi:Equilibrative nucleoside transporter 1 [Gryllus bimaculatus]|nr:Equilibrative nucleoside transporter 1 [Gryllus bimaculatus]
MVEVVLFIFTVALAMTDSTEWRGTFFWCTILTVILLNMANGIYQNTVFGMAAKLPFKYTGAVILGTRYYRYHELLGKKTQHRQVAGGRAHKPRIPYGTIIKQCWPQLYNVFFIFFVTLAVFPALIASIKPSNEKFFVPKDIFSDVTCFLTFNVCAMLGSLLATWISWPSPKYLAIPVTLRVLFIPFFVFCNYVPHDKRILTILIYNEYVFWGGVVLMAFTSGYFSALGMEFCPRSVEPQNAPIAGMLGGAFMITGIFSGVVFSMIFPPLVSLIPL